MTTIFTDNLSSGNLNAWTGSGTQNGTVDFSQTQAAPFTQGSIKGMVTSTPGWAMEYKDITSTTTVYWAAQLRIDSHSIPNGQIAKFMELVNSANFYPVARLGVINDNGTLKWALSYGNGNGTETFVTSQSALNTQQWYSVQIAAYANSTTGWTRLWVGGSSIIYNQNVNTGSAITKINVGASDQVCTAYIGNVIASDASIGTCTLTISSTSNGTTWPTSNQACTETTGTYQYMSATADSGYVFDHWERDNITNLGSTNPYNVLMDGNFTIQAVFADTDPVIQGDTTIIGSLTVTENAEINNNLTVDNTLVMHAPNQLDHIDLQAISDTTPPNSSIHPHLTLQISQGIEMPYQFPVEQKTQIPSDLWGYDTNGNWTPGGLPVTTAFGRITFRDTNSGSNKSLDIFGMISTYPNPYEYEPLLATNVGMIVQKDFSAGGFLSSQQGALWLGSGLNSQYDDPKIILFHDAAQYGTKTTLYLKTFSGGNGNLDLGNLIVHGNITLSGSFSGSIPWASITGAPSFLTTVTPSNLSGSGPIPSGWTIQGSQVQGNISGNATCITGTIACNQISDISSLVPFTIEGYRRIKWDYAATEPEFYNDVGSIVFHNTTDDIGMEFKGTYVRVSGQLQTVMQIVRINNFSGSATWEPVFQFDNTGIFHFKTDSVQGFDSIDDLGILRAMKTKTDKNGNPTFDSSTLKFLQDDKGLFSLNACLGWELSIQQKFLQEIDSLKLKIADLQTQLNTVKAK